jgi:hypothetical protein
LEHFLEGLEQKGKILINLAFNKKGWVQGHPTFFESVFVEGA